MSGYKEMTTPTVLHFEDEQRDTQIDNWRADTRTPKRRKFRGEAIFRLRGHEASRSRSSHDLAEVPPDKITEMEQLREEQLREQIIKSRHFSIDAVERKDDYWSKHGQLWVRHHVVPRTTLYAPATEPNEPNVDLLHSSRKTYMVTANGEAGSSTDDWRYNRDCIPGLLADQPKIVFEFTGTSSFMEPLDLNPQVKLEVTEELARPLPKPTSQAQKARAPPTPKEPTWQERELHELTHLPFRSWCPLCVETT